MKVGARRLATALAIVVASGFAGGGMACGSMSRGAASNPAPATGGAVPLSRALVLGTSGPAPHDTAVTFRAGERRAILFTHPPDNLLFAEFVFPPSAFAADSGHDVTVRLHARPGVYGVDVDASAAIGDGAYVTFNYPRYFTTPAAARAVYGSDVAFERALAVARLRADSMLVFLPASRPAPDNLQARLPSAGTYFVAAPQ